MLASSSWAGFGTASGVPGYELRRARDRARLEEYDDAEPAVFLLHSELLY